MTRLFKTLAAIGILLFFTLGAFAVSFAANDSPSAWPLYKVELHRVHKNGHAQLDRYTLSVGMESETGDAPNCAQPVLAESRVRWSPVVELANRFSSADIHAPKVSLQLLELVLLL